MDTPPIITLSIRSKEGEVGGEKKGVEVEETVEKREVKVDGGNNN